jgi:arabinose-5-phosphate isomerase
LSDILTYCARSVIPTIGVSSKPDSTLMKAVTYRLTLPKAPEACPTGMAPTTSTTLMLAIGDALAVALMEARGFKEEDFKGFHPGGKLGAKMRRVEDLMHDGTNLPLVSEDTPMVDVLVSMSSKGLGVAAIVDTDGCLSGIITDGDVRRHIGDLMTKTANEIATKDPITVGPHILAARALAIMNEYKISALMVIDECRHPVGVLHVHDCLRAGVD